MSDVLEKRHLAACVLIMDGDRVALFADKPKQECAAGTPWSKPESDKHTKWSVPGGGGVEGESFLATIMRELVEEVFVEPGQQAALLESLAGMELHQSPPFLAAQRAENQETINILAATSACIDLQSLHPELQLYLQRLEDDGRMCWRNIAELAVLYQDILDDRDADCVLRDFRAHTLLAAYFWYMDQSDGVIKALNKIAELNAQSYTEVIQTAKDNALAISNGTFTAGGHIDPDLLPDSDKAFLGLVNHRTRSHA